MVSGSISLPSRGSFHLSLTVLLHYRSSGSIQPWEVVLPASHKVSRVSWYSGAELFIIAFTYKTITSYGPTFQLCSVSNNFTLCSVRNPEDKSSVWALSLSLAATQKIDFSFSSSRYLDVSVPQVFLHKAMNSLYDTWGFPCEFPHSEISGSLAMCAYPKLIAAYHVLHRLLMPRHSPCALCSLTFLLVYSQRIYFLACCILYTLIYVQFSKNILKELSLSKLNRSIIDQ